MFFSETWNDTEKLMLVAVGTLAGHARRMLDDPDNIRAGTRKAYQATAEALRRLREETARLATHPKKAAQHLAVGLSGLAADAPSDRLDGKFIRAIAEVAFDGGEAPKLAAPEAEDVVVEDDDDIGRRDTDKIEREDD